MAYLLGELPETETEVPVTEGSVRKPSFAAAQGGGRSRPRRERYGVLSEANSTGSPAARRCNCRRSSDAVIPRNRAKELRQALRFAANEPDPGEPLSRPLEDGSCIFLFKL